MNTTIELMSNEFDEEAFKRIKSFLLNKPGAKVFICISDKPKDFPPKETREEYINRLDTAINNVEKGNAVNFTWDEFDAHVKHLLNEP